MPSSMAQGSEAAEELAAEVQLEEPVEPGAPDTSVSCRKLPEGWCWATVDQVAETVSGGYTKPGKEPSYRSEDRFPG